MIHIIWSMIVMLFYYLLVKIYNSDDLPLAIGIKDSFKVQIIVNVNILEILYFLRI